MHNGFLRADLPRGEGKREGRFATSIEVGTACDNVGGQPTGTLLTMMQVLLRSSDRSQITKDEMRGREDERHSSGDDV